MGFFDSTPAFNFDFLPPSLGSLAGVSVDPEEKRRRLLAELAARIPEPEPEASQPAFHILGDGDGLDQEGSGDVDPLPQVGGAEPPPNGRTGGGLLDLLAGRMDDLGHGGGEDAKRQALRTAMMALGGHLTANATKEGIGALGAGVTAGFGAYAGSLDEQEKGRKADAQLALKMRQEGLQADYTRALTDQAREGILTKQEKAQQTKDAIEQRRASIAERDAFIAGLSPEQGAILRGVRGVPDANWAEAVTKVTKEPPPDKTVKAEIPQGGAQIVLKPGTDPSDPSNWVKVYERAPAVQKWQVMPTGGGGSKHPYIRIINGKAMMWDGDLGKFVEPAGAPPPPDDIHKQAVRLYQDALGNPASKLQARNADGSLDVNGTWRNAQAAAATSAPTTGGDILGDPGPPPGEPSLPPPAPNPKTAPAAPGSPASKARAAIAQVAPPTKAQIQAVRDGLAKDGAAEVRRKLLSVGKTPAEIANLLRLAAGG